MTPVSQGLERRDRDLVAGALQTLLNHLGDVRQTLSNLSVTVPAPPDLARLIETTTALQQGVIQGRMDLPLLFSDEQLSIMRCGLALHRRSVAERVEETQGKLVTPEQIASVKKEVEPLDALLRSSFLERVDPLPLPRLATYLTAYGREGLTRTRELAPEEPEPKHRILLSASLIPHDVAVYRHHCENRRVPLAVVFADLDDFKAYNTAKSEVYVDRFVLPPILNAVEAACYGHGRAYRHGGDEFVFLLPNATEAVALSVASQLARLVAQAELEGLPHPPRLSTGIWITHPESHLTSSELVDAAATAKQNSKKVGRNRITVRVERASRFEESVTVVPL